MKRRKFISSVAASMAGISIVPRHVLGGAGYVAPSEQITVANIGCGTQGLRELPGMLENPAIRVVAACDPNQRSSDYIDWSPHGLRNRIRECLNDPDWGKHWKGISGGREVAKDMVDQFYRTGTGNGCTAYQDFRELLEQETDLDAVKIMTPDHLHATIAVAAMKRGLHVVTHKPIANRVAEGGLVVETAKKTGVMTHLLAWSERPEHLRIRQWLDRGAIGTLKEIHNWTNRPVWPQWTERPKQRPPLPANFNWDLWLGPVPDLPYHPNYTHNVFRGWYDFGGGAIADMGHYSLFPLFQNLGIKRPPYRIKAYGTTTRQIVDQVSRPVNNEVAFPSSSMVRMQFRDQPTFPAFDLIWYDGGMKPFPPEELAEDDRDLPKEGMLLVGDKGKILADFMGRNPELIPTKRMEGYVALKETERERSSDIWSRSIKTNTESPGSFQKAATITETLNLATVALRTGEEILYDAQTMRITNHEKANAFLTRNYRQGWELPMPALAL